MNKGEDCKNRMREELDTKMEVCENLEGAMEYLLQTYIVVKKFKDSGLLKKMTIEGEGMSEKEKNKKRY